MLGVGFPPNKTTSYRGRIRIPTDLTGVAAVLVAWRGWLLGRSAGELPPLTMTWRRIARPVPPELPTDLPTSSDEGALVLDTSGLAAFTANQYAEVESAVMAGVPGDSLLFSITREAEGGDGYDDEVHVINQYGKITGTS